ncbi:hypothetical protein ACF0H5_008505 [Mactra antiquata]
MLSSISWRNKIKTLMIFMAWITKGLYLEALGPAMIDLKLIYSTNYESITRAVSGRGAGGFIGAVLGAFIVDKYEGHLDLCMALGTMICGVSVLLVPLLPSIDYVWFLYILIGCNSCMVNMAGTRIALKIWRDRSSTVLQLLHMGFGVGALLVPLLCYPFLAVVEAVHSDNGNKDGDYHVIKESRVHIAFVFIGLFTCAVAIPFFIFQINDKSSLKSNTKESAPVIDTKEKSIKEIINPATYADGNFWIGFSTLSFLSLYYFNLLGGEKTFATFTRTISVDVFHLDKAQASYLNMIFWLSLTLGRLCGSIVSRHVEISRLITIYVILHGCSLLALNLFGLSSAYSFFALTILIGVTVAPLYPLGIAYGNSLINMTGFCLMVVIFTGSFGDFAYLWTAGRIYDMYGASAIFQTAAVAAWLIAGSVILFRIFVKFINGSSK